ncbi:DMT family transporter [Methanococcoides methylutens]|uniref:Integral membrane protein n=1 Tax=Methanococcoides methylutens MM1 TaxID=1434104 RepID=A0A0E3SQ33_METMT|nr:DMT family transporter [Methanococcoides methylutens]AKB84671.1 integral membrane protein [Methanococcoides methylutens MM1]
MGSAPVKGYMEITAGCIIYGMVGVFLAFIHDMGTLPIIFYKLLIGIFFMLAYLYLRGDLGILRLGGKRRHLLLLGIFKLMTISFYFTCIIYSGLSIAILLLYTAPMYVTILSPIVLGEKVTRSGLVGLVLSMIGIILIVDPATLVRSGIDDIHFIGMAAGILSGISFSFIIMTARYVRDEYSGFSQFFWATVFCVVVLVPFAPTVSIPVLRENFLMLLLFGLVNTSISGVLYFNGLSRVRTQAASILAMLEPVSGIFFDYTILHSAIFAETIVGCVFIIGGALLAVSEHLSFGKYLKFET